MVDSISSQLSTAIACISPFSKSWEETKLSNYYYYYHYF